MPTLNEYLLMSGLLFVIGLSGVLLRGNIIVILMSLEMMLSAANLALVSFWRFGGGGGLLGECLKLVWQPLCTGSKFTNLDQTHSKCVLSV